MQSKVCMIIRTFLFFLRNNLGCSWWKHQCGIKPSVLLVLTCLLERGPNSERQPWKDVGKGNSRTILRSRWKWKWNLGIVGFKKSYNKIQRGIYSTPWYSHSQKRDATSSLALTIVWWQRIINTKRSINRGEPLACLKGSKWCVKFESKPLFLALGNWILRSEFSHKNMTEHYWQLTIYHLS